MRFAETFLFVTLIVWPPGAAETGIENVTGVLEYLSQPVKQQRARAVILSALKYKWIKVGTSLDCFSCSSKSWHASPQNLYAHTLDISCWHSCESHDGAVSATEATKAP